jgi:hypothetical protein
MVEAELARRKLVELHGRLGPCFGRVEPFRQAGKYIAGLMSDLPRKNAWTIAELPGMGLLASPKSTVRFTARRQLLRAWPTVVLVLVRYLRVPGGQ